MSGAPRRVLATLAGLALAAAAADACAASMTPLDLCEMQPVFMDDFENLSIAPHMIGPARWTAHTPWNGDFGDAAFIDPGPAGPFARIDGHLGITASRRPDGHWRSGLIAAADGDGRGTGVRYGYFEARMKLPPGPGTWPAFWLGTLRPASETGPGIEIDVIEYYGHATAAFKSALHVWIKPPGASRQVLHEVGVPDGSLVAAFHSYGVRVAPEQLTFYLDRVATWQVPTPPELQKPLFPLVNLALGSGFPIAGTPDPSTLLVDYVHVYALDPAGRASRCAAGTAP